MPRLTQQQFADHVFLDKAAVSRMVKDGQIDLKKGMEEARKIYITRLREQAAGRLGLEPGEFDLTAERARLAHHQANEKALQVKVLQGELIPIDEVTEHWTKMVSNMRAVILSIPTKLASVVPVDNSKDVECRAKEIVYQSLEEISSNDGAPNAKHK